MISSSKEEMTYVTTFPDLSDTQLLILRNLVLSARQKRKIKPEGGGKNMMKKRHTKEEAIAVWHFTVSLGLFPEPE